MVPAVRATLDGRDLSIAIVRSRFNEAITERLLRGALQALDQHHVSSDRITVVEVPGAVELALAADWLLKDSPQGPFDALVCLGAIIEGETRHFDSVCRLTEEGIGAVMRTHRIPIVFGVLTCTTMEQALARSGAGSANRGFDAALVALEMGNLARQLRKNPKS